MVKLSLFTALLVGAAAGIAEEAPQVMLDLRGDTIRGDLIVDAVGREVGRLSADATRGATATLTPDGGLVLGGQVYGESLATLAAEDAFPSADYVFETHFALAQPTGFYSHMVILSPRAGDDPDAPSYRISYRFANPCPAANNSTGFYLINTGTQEYKDSPLWANPVAGARYRLAYGREYVAYTAIQDLPDGVHIRFYLHDTTLAGDDAEPLFEYTDTAATRITGAGPVRVEVGSGGLIHPAAPVWFGGMKLYPLEHLDAARREQTPTAGLLASELVAPPAPRRTELPNLFADNLVLQRGKPIAVWGHGIDGDEVSVTLAGSAAKAAVADGQWRVDLSPLPAGGPYQLTATGRDRTVTAQNVMIGEVWVLGGQSNMGWWLKSTTEAETEVPASDLPDVRVFSGWHPAAGEPQFEMAGGTWKVIAPSLDGAFSAVGYYFAKALHKELGVPIGLVDTSTPATTIECWVSARAAEGLFGGALTAQPGRFPAELSDPACYYNGKVAPIMPLGVAGFVWYQGDGSTSATGSAYRARIPALIRDWREGFAQGDLPFLIVQIPQFEGCSPEMRESQLLAARNETSTGLAVTLDVGDPVDIHPRNKRPVGERLALLARAMAYGEAIECSGPLYRAMTVSEGKAHLTFDHVGGGLALHGAGGFEVCGGDGVFVDAQVDLAGTDGLVVWSDAVPEPVAVRYAWAPVPKISLYNDEGLPGSPFRTGGN